jgi:parvulin-like peptidyl-prolyl isomerase
MEVWDKLKFDSLLARKYWDTTKTKYKTQAMYDISEIYVLSDSTARDIYNQLIKGANFDELAEIHTQRKGYREKKGYWGEVSADKNELVKAILDKKAKENSLLEPVAIEKGFSIIKYNKFVPVRQKTFEEAIPDFAPQFQDLMQKKLLNSWIDEIKKKLDVKIYKDKIVSVNKKLKK